MQLFSGPGDNIIRPESLLLNYDFWEHVHRCKKAMTWEARVAIKTVAMRLVYGSFRKSGGATLIPVLN